MRINGWSRRELARAGRMGAKVGPYRGVLTASSEHGMQHRQERLAADPARMRSVPPPAEKQGAPPDLHRWEDDGGSVRKRYAARTTERACLAIAARVMAMSAVVSL